MLDVAVRSGVPVEQNADELFAAPDAVGFEARIAERPVVPLRVPAFAAGKRLFVKVPRFGPAFVRTGFERYELQLLCHCRRNFAQDSANSAHCQLLRLSAALCGRSGRPGRRKRDARSGHPFRRLPARTFYFLYYSVFPPVTSSGMPSQRTKTCTSERSSLAVQTIEVSVKSVTM